MATEKQREAARALLKRQWTDPVFRAKVTAANSGPANHPTGPAHHNWKGRGTRSDGYVWVRTPDGGTRWEHHLVWEAAHPNDPILPGEVIHHINRIRDDNRIENLQKISSALHAVLHHKGKQHTPEHAARIAAANKGRISRYPVKVCGRAHHSCLICRPDMYTDGWRAKIATAKRARDAAKRQQP